MKKFFLGLFFCGLMVTACSDEDKGMLPGGETTSAIIKLGAVDYENETTRSVAQDNDVYDRVDYYIMDENGEPVRGIKSYYIPETAEIVTEGLQKGKYTLLVLGVKGNAADDQATIHTLTHASDTWLSFPEDLQRPLQAEYFYSRTPFSVTVTDAGSGREEVAHIQQTIVQRRIVGRADFSFSYNNPYVRTAVSSNKVHWQGGRFYTSFAADSVFAGSSDGVIREEDLLRSSSCMFMPTREDEALEGNIELRTRSYEGEGQKQTYG